MDEPASGIYVAVKTDMGIVEVYRRRDELAVKYAVGDARWGCTSSLLRPALTWHELTTMGAVALVSDFVGGA